MLRFLTVALCLTTAVAGGVLPAADAPTTATSKGARGTASPLPTDAEHHTLTAQPTIQGISRPYLSADLPPLVRGTIHTVHVDEGQQIRQGDPLITLDNRIAQAHLHAARTKATQRGGLQRAEVELRIARRRLERLEQIVVRGAGADFELEEAQANCDRAQAMLQHQQDQLRTAEAECQLAQAQLDQYTIRAPFDGVVTEIHQHSGAVDLSTPVVSVANLNRLDVELHLPTKMFGQLRPGDSAQLHCGTPIRDGLTATVVSVSPVIHAGSETFRCLLQVENPDARYPAGFSVRLKSHGAGRPNTSTATANGTIRR